MATKKPSTVVTKSELLKVREDVRLVGKNAADLRKSFAGTLGTISRIEGEVPQLKEKVKELSGKVTKLFRDPIYAVPEGLKKSYEELKRRFDKHLRDYKDDRSAQSVHRIELQTACEDNSKALSELIKGVEKLSARVDAIEEALNQVEGEVGSLASDAAPIAPVKNKEPVQMHLAEAANLDGYAGDEGSHLENHTKDLDTEGAEEKEG